MRFIHSRSAPAENDRPAAASTTMRMLSSASIERSASVSSAMIASSNALWRSGRLRVTSPSGPWRSRASAADILRSLHAEDAEARLLERGLLHDFEREPEHAARVGGVDDAVVPQPGAGVIGVSLALVLLANRRLEAFLFLRGPLAAAALDAVALHRGEHRRRLLAAHHRDACIRPGPQEARVECTPAHAVVARAERAAEDHRELGHLRARHGGDHLRPVPRDALVLVFLPDHEAGDVLQEQQRNAALRAQLDEMRALERRFG